MIEFINDWQENPLLLSYGMNCHQIKYSQTLLDGIAAAWPACACVCSVSCMQNTKPPLQTLRVKWWVVHPGGHADGEYDLYSVALREVEEETGLKVEPMFGQEIYAIQAAPVKGHVKNGKYVSAHTHYDVLFMFKVKNEDMDKVRVLASENTSVEGWELCDTFTKDCVVDWAKPVNRKIVQKMDY